MTLSTTSYEFGDVVLVPFPFTDQTTSKKRPAVVISSSAYHEARPDLIIMAITSQLKASPTVGESAIAEWKETGLLRPSVMKPVLTTIERGLVLKKLGSLGSQDQQTLSAILDVILGRIDTPGTQR
ncbi:MAG: type II toxin-antitoxin system PemK/MazF family toxin [Desulfurellaceae bacterium]|nr:type II toxin-antitoxin system PemK/MazF family toxin [Desulfurellaceae bacterium]